MAYINNYPSINNFLY